MVKIGWIYETRLSPGMHNITLSLDDGIHDPVVVSRTVEILQSAPVLELSSPADGDAYSSSSLIEWDAQSVDYDGDTFTMTVRSDLLNEPLFADVSPSIVTHRPFRWRTYRSDNTHGFNRQIRNLDHWIKYRSIKPSSLDVATSKFSINSGGSTTHS